MAKGTPRRRISKLITGQIIIDANQGEYSFEPKERFLVLKSLNTGKSEVVNLPLGETSLSFIDDKKLNEDSFIKFADDDVYDEVYVKDRTERNIVLNKLERVARELKVA